MPINRRFKATNSMLFIIFMTFLVLVAYLKFLDFKTSVVIGHFAEKQLERQDKRIEELIRENEQLKEKLENSSKVQVPEATKNVVKFYLQKYFGDKAEMAERIFTCESGLSPTSLHINRQGLGADYGVAQINNKWHEARFTKMFDVDWEEGIYDIGMNIKYAKYLYDTHGNFSAWVCSKII